jgi:hypothetical protein
LYKSSKAAKKRKRDLEKTARNDNSVTSVETTAFNDESFTEHDEPVSMPNPMQAVLPLQSSYTVILSSEEMKGNPAGLSGVGPVSVVGSLGDNKIGPSQWVPEDHRIREYQYDSKGTTLNNVYDQNELQSEKPASLGDSILKSSPQSISYQEESVRSHDSRLSNSNMAQKSVCKEKW